MESLQPEQILSSGALVLVLDVPVGSEFGIDYKSWHTAARFKGVKLVPAGVHYVFCSARQSRSEHGQHLGPRIGYFVHTAPGDVLIFKWDPTEEHIVNTHADADQQQRVRDDYVGLDPYLAAYPLEETLSTWISLTSKITRATLARLQPTCEYISSATELEGAQVLTSRRSDRPDQAAAGTEEQPATPAQSIFETHKDAWRDMRPASTVQIPFVQVPRRLFPPGATPAQVTQHSLDRSYTLQQVLTSHFAHDPNELLAELQYAFVCFLVGQVYEAFETWKQLVALLCNSGQAIADHPQLYIDFMGVLHYQLKETPSDFFFDIVASNNFLVHALEAFFAHAEHTDNVAQHVRTHAHQFKSWNFDDEDDGDGPVVVET
ncbi:uncharacterized protein MONBRDRAFT_21032 [Monosiga brevicollis MX1]|uniref:Protein AAR2 homolog n=1 Tax=Monosiga brevicollis TaxID=81824 RepID=A9UPH9_MONBE|nr:uncharacterized protein MONBRDRAFT_21032 [Monosiga brevicollis MX1]EDQ92873.1 predicted protein [Monosiga brevicollis MX1]|eukprot:XP_001742635.1 hypothetical protein [Monosiga brevicollis MX1]